MFKKNDRVRLIKGYPANGSNSRDNTYSGQLGWIIKDTTTTTALLLLDNSTKVWIYMHALEKIEDNKMTTHDSHYYILIHGKVSGKFDNETAAKASAAKYAKTTDGDVIVVKSVVRVKASNELVWS